MYDQFGHPKITAANDSPDSKPLFARLLTSALALYVASTARSLTLTAGIPGWLPRDRCSAPYQNR
jgi:hypothetical protein